MDLEDVDDLLSLARVTDETRLKLRRVNYRSHVVLNQITLDEASLEAELEIINKAVVQPHSLADKKVEGEFVLL